MQLPDSLIVRYFRADELDQVTKVTTRGDKKIEVTLKIRGHARTDLWEDLGGGLGYVPSAA